MYCSTNTIPVQSVLHTFNHSYIHPASLGLQACIVQASIVMITLQEIPVYVYVLYQVMHHCKKKKKVEHVKITNYVHVQEDMLARQSTQYYSPMCACAPTVP